MHEALLVNPYDVDQVADALDRALRMEENERRTRMDALRARERSWDVHAWVEFFLGAAQQAATEGGGS
jgi:trehalose-6-phosphate synthase